MDSTCTFDVSITAADVAAFAKLSGDHNPLHMDVDYAKKTEFGRPVVHGVFLLGLVSRVLGMHIPGQRSLILSINTQFPKPLYYPTNVRVEGRLKNFNPQRQTGTVEVIIVDQSKLSRVLQAEVAFVLHELVKKEAPPPILKATHVKSGTGKNGKPRLLITGGSGGIGSELLPLLSRHYEATALSRKIVDLEEPGGFETFLANHPSSDYFGVVHLSVPPISRAFVSDDLAAVKRHWRHAVEIPLLLTQWARAPRSEIKRIVLMGSTAGKKYPKPETGPYSLGKAAMEHLTRMLPYDLAAQGATVNIVIPTAIPVGLNEGLPERARKSLAGKMPSGRMVKSGDIANVILFLLSSASSQINGTAISVDGGLLE